MFKKLFLVLLLIPVIAFAQSAGKMTGVIIDQSTGEPLPGVNVILEGTMLGASTDIDGYFVVLNIPVGVYSIRASYIGYKEVMIENVRVSAGITTEMNFTLEPTTLELEEAIVVTAERPLVEKHVTSSISLVTAEEIETLPVRGLGSLVQIQNSVVVQDGQVHIRGGRDDEVGYYIDGASANNVLTNSSAVYVIQEAIEEFQVFAGGWNAEFGGANSGIIRAELKSGTPDYHASALFETDKFVGEGKEFLNTYSYQHHTGVVTLSGPIVSDKVRFYIAGENTYMGDRDMRFSRGYSMDDFFAPDVPVEERYIVDTNPDNTVHDTIRALSYPDGFTPNRDYKLYSMNGTLSFDLQPIKVRFSGSYSNSTTGFPAGALDATDDEADQHPMLSVLDNRTMEDDYSSLLLNTKVTYIITPTAFADARISFFQSNLERNDPYFGGDWWSWFDSTAVSNASGGDIVYRDRWNPKYDYRLNGFPIVRPGDPSEYYRIEDQQYISGAIDFVSQIGRNHEVKIGGEVRMYTIRHFDNDPSNIGILPGEFEGELSLNQLIGEVNETGENVVTFKNGTQANNYGYDIYGRESSADKFQDIQFAGKTLRIQTAEAPKEPIFYSFYVQDKIEFNDLIINAGLRLDFFETDDYKFKDPANPDIDTDLQAFKPEAFEKVETFTNLSPRLGVSFPVTERTVFYVQYGKFVQMPEFFRVYAGKNRLDFELIQSGFSFQFPLTGFGAEPVKTTSYEIGFRQQLGSRAAFDLTGFYKNVKGQLQIDRQQIDALSELPGPYNVLDNSDFATTKGVEFRLTLRRTNRLQAQLNYTLTDAEGTGSGSVSFRGPIERTTIKPSFISPLEYAQRHVGSVILDYRFGINDGGPILSQLGANVLFNFSSGHAFTRANPLAGGQIDPFNAGTDYMLDSRSRKAAEAIGASTTPWTFTLDLRLDKTFNITRKLQANVYARVTNLFNTKNEINVFQKTGNATDDGWISDRGISQATIDGNGGDSYVRMYQILNIDNGQSYWQSNAGVSTTGADAQLYSHPRQILVGIQLFY